MLSRQQLFGIRLDCASASSAASAIHAHAQTGGGLVCVANVDMVTRAVSDRRLAHIMERAVTVVTDGMPLVWSLRAQGQSAASRVYGPHLMRSLCALAEKANTPIFLFGGSETESQLLQQQLARLYPQLRVVGALSPAMLPTSPPLDLAVAQSINATGARLIFVGLGCPKQEYWMDTHEPHLNGLAIGVGYAFSQLAGLKAEAPAWMQGLGLEWIFRVWQEPGRLWRRYLVGNSRFVWYSLRSALGWRGPN
jgi:N-acetylglucosaminyldiphosphoundecaprenol N-acetyl-beta-D-mannosaminyltransferase